MHLGKFPDLTEFQSWIVNFRTELCAKAKNPTLALQWIKEIVRGVSWSEVATVPKRKSHRGLDLDLSLNSEVNIWKGWKENSGMK